MSLDLEMIFANLQYQGKAIIFITHVLSCDNVCRYAQILAVCVHTLTKIFQGLRKKCESRPLTHKILREFLGNRRNTFDYAQFTHFLKIAILDILRLFKMLERFF